MESTLASVQDFCSALNNQASHLNAGAAFLREQKRIALMQLKVHPSGAGLIPSGPRKRGEGCDDENQGIVAAEETPTGGARLRVTLLAAGFVIGPGGSSIRAISNKSGADIRSWNDSLTTNGRARRVRTIVIEGNHRSVCLALAILCEAIELYKELCEGKYCGKHVDRCQYIRGVEFFYSPPPRSAVPYAAALKPESSNGSPVADTDSLHIYVSPSSGGSTALTTPHSASKSFLNPAFQKENQSIHALHSLTGCIPATAAAFSGSTTTQLGSAVPVDPGMVATFETATGLYMSTNNAVSMVTTAEVASRQAELTSCAATDASAPSALAAALTGPSTLSLIPHNNSANVNTMAPETPLASHKMYDTDNRIDPSDPGAGTIIVATTTAPNSVQLPAPQFLKTFDPQNIFSAINNTVNMSSDQQSVHAPSQPQPEPAQEPIKEVPCYSLFGPDGNVFGPSLLRDIWGPDGNGPGLPPIPSWRGNAPVAVNDDQLNMIGLPSYEDFAEKSPYYSANSNFLRNALKSSGVPPLRINNNGFLFSAYEDNSASTTFAFSAYENNSASTTSTTTPSNNSSEHDYIAAANKRDVYCNPATNSAQDEPMHDVQQQ
ncbi:hypothetical protein Ndes2526B_g07141 [Nannochloris sp. 'desiccata']